MSLEKPKKRGLIKPPSLVNYSAANSSAAPVSDAGL